MLAQSTPYLILPNENSGIVQLKVSGLLNVITEDSGYEYLAVFLNNEANEYHTNAIQGRYKVEGDFLVFTPYFPFEKGLIYVARIQDPQEDSGYRFTEFKVGEKTKVEEAKLLSIYPTADELPENLLRLYFYFSTPMKKDQAIQHIHLVDSEGTIDAHAFMEFKQELWSADGKRLTLLFDPGRIKRGVSTNLELGPALQEGNTYQLVVSGKWQDVYGQKLGMTETKNFQIGAAYRTLIDISRWNVNEPEAKSTLPLTIQLDRIMDHALIQSMIQIKKEENQSIQGSWEISEGESVLHFSPVEKWQKGNYEIVFDSGFEDVAGNNLSSLLDQPKTQQYLNSRTDYSIRFEIQ